MKMFKNLTAAVVISMCSISAMYASAAEVEVEAPKTVVVSPALEAAKDADKFDKAQMVAGNLLANKDNIVKDAKEILEEGKEVYKQYTSSKEVYEDLCKKHEGELKWYQKVKYGIQAYAPTAVSAVKAIVKFGKAVYTDVVLPIMEAVDNK